ncbi:MAG: hypothetical protein R2755_07125 [Acidimicrobiales bacterium]
MPAHLPATRSTGQTEACRAAIDAQRDAVQAFDPQLVLCFGTDHYGGFSMSCMPSFCVGTRATALADVGGFPGVLDVPEPAAEALVDHLRAAGIDTAVSYAMEVDHGFSQVLHEFTGAVDRYPVLPVFVNCIAKPFVPFARMRALGEAVGSFLPSLGLDRVLIVGTGGISHDPSRLFPTIHDVPAEWLPYHLLGTKQETVPRQVWIDWEIEIHAQGAAMLADESTGLTLEQLSIIETFDRPFLELMAAGDLDPICGWEPDDIVAQAGIGALETMSWVAARAAAAAVGVDRAEVPFYSPIRDFGVGFGILSGRS